MLSKPEEHELFNTGRSADALKASQLILTLIKRPLINAALNSAPTCKRSWSRRDSRSQKSKIPCRQNSVSAERCQDRPALLCPPGPTADLGDCSTLSAHWSARSHWLCWHTGTHYWFTRTNSCEKRLGSMDAMVLPDSFMKYRQLLPELFHLATKWASPHPEAVNVVRKENWIGEIKMLPWTICRAAQRESRGRKSLAHLLLLLHLGCTSFLESYIFHRIQQR